MSKEQDYKAVSAHLTANLIRAILVAEDFTQAIRQLQEQVGQAIEEKTMTCPSCGAPHSECTSCGYCEEYPESRLTNEQADNPYVRDLVDHKRRVKTYMQSVASELMRRSFVHDNSKFEPEEYDAYSEAFPGLQKYAYGTDEFKAELAKIQSAIQHHYQANDHHPEHFENGIIGMNLIQVIEMVCDWMAASERSQTNVYQGMELNRKRFGIDPQLINIIAGTIAKLKESREEHQP